MSKVEPVIMIPGFAAEYMDGQQLMDLMSWAFEVHEQGRVFEREYGPDHVHTDNDPED